VGRIRERCRRGPYDASDIYSILGALTVAAADIEQISQLPKGR
jgi:hypothetical protein